MTRQVGTREYTTFVKGLITEANELTYPENASKDELNFELLRNGARRRRLGIDYETNYTELPSAGIAEAPFEGGFIDTYLWENADNNADNVFAVVHIGGGSGDDKLYFNPVSGSTFTNGTMLELDISTYRSSYAGTGYSSLHMTQAEGFLVCVGELYDPFFVVYDPDAVSMSATEITIEIRDLLGVDDTLENDENPAGLTDYHKYNLLNQGWDETKISDYVTGQSVYPSNAQVWTAGKDATDLFDDAELVKVDFGNSPAPKGRYILDAFNRDRATVSSGDATPTLSIDVDADRGRPTTAAFYSGRVFYSGVESDRVDVTPESPGFGHHLTGYVYYSQILTDFEDKIGKCYQAADPTSEYIFDTVATDGGYIQIPGSGLIHRLVPIKNYLMVFASEGVWAIHGGDQPFTATNQQIDKVSNVGSLSHDTVVEVEGTVYYFSSGGVYLLQTAQQGRNYSTSNIISNTIQTLYNDISTGARLHAKGLYDPASKKIHFLYNDTTDYGSDTNPELNKYESMLIYDTVLEAWTKYKFESLASNSPYVGGITLAPAATTTNLTNQVVSNSGADTVQSASGVNQVITTTSRVGTSGALQVKYLAIIQHTASLRKYTYCDLTNTDFVDWFTEDSTGINFDSYLVTGIDVFGDTMRKKTAPYLVTHMVVTETQFVAAVPGPGLELDSPSGLFVQPRWDFSNSTASGKWGTAQQCYTFKRTIVGENPGDPYDYGQDVLSSRLKLRGSGKGLSLYFYSEDGKDAYLLGWGILISGGSAV